MFKKLYKYSVLVLMASFLGFATSAYAGDEPNVLVLNEDVDRDSVPNDSRINKRILRAIDNQLGDMGIKVFDETAVSLEQGFATGQTRRSDAEIIDIAKLISRPPIDVAVIYTTYASIKSTSYINKVKIRVEGRLLNVKTGRNLGSFELKSPKEWTAPVDCNRECILEEVGDDARVIANDVGAVLGEKLVWMVDGGGSSEAGGDGTGMAYTLEFDGFTPEEMMEVEEYLIIFSGYKSHRPIYSGARRSEIWYETSIKSAKLNRNMTKMLAELDLRGLVQFSGNTVKVEKISLRGKKSREDTSGW
jgi:hypothetical protein